MTDVATPRPRSRRRLFVIVGVIAVVLLGLLAGGYFYGKASANDVAAGYDEDFARWNRVDKKDLFRNSSSLPGGTWIDLKAATSDPIDMLRDGCDTVAAKRASLRQSYERLPTLPDSKFGFLSSSYEKAADRVKKREKIVAAYLAAATKTFTQMERDCRWNVVFSTAELRTFGYYEKAEKYVFKKGGSEPGVICNEKSGCLSSIASKREAQADLWDKAVKNIMTKSVPALESKRCRATSYGAACAVIAKQYRAVSASQSDLADAVRDVKDYFNDWKKVDAARVDLAKVINKADKKVSLKLVALHPALADDSSFVDNPFSTYEIFHKVTGIALKELTTKQSALKKL
jgi:hypothetical protein